MTTLLFALLAAAMIGAWRGHKRAGMALFVVAALLSLAWFNHHAVDALNLDF